MHQRDLFPFQWECTTDIATRAFHAAFPLRRTFAHTICTGTHVTAVSLFDRVPRPLTWEQLMACGFTPYSISQTLDVIADAGRYTELVECRKRFECLPSPDIFSGPAVQEQHTRIQLPV
jgi:hypothetical protein